MRKYLLPEAGCPYKANLHSHSKLSDGRLTVEEMKAEYKQRGYSIVAFSDHDALHGHPELCDDEFVAITSYEISVRSDDVAIPHAYRKVVDLNFFAKDPHNNVQIGYHPETVEWLVQRGKLSEAERDAIRYAPPLRDCHYYPANINRIIKSANENGWLVTINHPMWSLMNWNDYAQFEGAWAVEVYNHGCAVLSGEADSETVYEDILRTGKRIFATATDDNHNSYPLSETRRCDSFGGWIMVGAKALDYASVMEALEAGDFYASTGPEIKALYVEDGYLCVETSEAAEICLNTLGRRGARAANDDGSPVTSARFKLDDALYGYVRLRVVDMRGKKAWTNPYYLDEISDTGEYHRIVF